MSLKDSTIQTTIHAVPTLKMEQAIIAQGFDLIIGLDEVGRGSLAGPVMVGAAALRSPSVQDHNVPTGLADSKMLTPHRRESLIEPLQTWSDAWSVGSASNHEIDQSGISHALGLAALRAISAIEDSCDVQAMRHEQNATETVQENQTAHLAPANQVSQPFSTLPRQTTVAVILDGPFDYITKALHAFDTPDVSIIPTVFTKIRADASCATVAAASVLAKVRRDALMTQLSQTHPEYQPFHWERNKGYGSAAHRAAIRQYGPSDLHRISWHLE
ncbi:ribonuclease HII [Bifidobacterium aquikefiri]|uniref:ribonuclease HII n=1 Tax=Bifidobacterium aquikefiri TaxID=1653207 RepID=UPI0039EA4995